MSTPDDANKTKSNEAGDEKPVDLEETIDDDVVENENEDGGEISSETTDQQLPSQYFHAIRPHPPPSIQERYQFYACDMDLDRCQSHLALKRICNLVEYQLSGVHWLAEITENVPIVELDLLENEVRYLVEVTNVQTVETNLGYDLFAETKFIKMLDAEDNEFRNTNPTEYLLLLKQRLREQSSLQDLIDLTPIEISEKEDELTEPTSLLDQSSNIAELIDHFRYYLHNVHRHYDLTETGNSSFSSSLRSRLTILDQMEKGKIPFAIKQRYYNVLNKYAYKLDKIDRLEVEYNEFVEYLQGNDVGHLEAESRREVYEEADTIRKELIHMHAERDMLAGLLYTWESFELTCTGPRWPKRLRISNGKRRSGRKIIHITQGPLNTRLLTELSSNDANCEFVQHASISDALAELHEGETLYIREYGTNGAAVRTDLHNLNENNIVLEGVGEVMIQAPSGDDIFVNISAQDVVLKNLAFIADDNSDGILRVESGGHAVLENCKFFCTNGSGVTVCGGARLTMKNCEIYDSCMSAAIIQEPGAQTKLDDVKFVKCKAGVEVQTFPKNHLPTISDCKFSSDCNYDVVVKQIGRAYGESDEICPVKYFPKGIDENEQTTVVSSEESDAQQQQAETQKAAGEVIPQAAKTQTVDVPENSTEEITKRLESANINVSNLEGITYRMVLI